MRGKLSEDESSTNGVGSEGGQYEQNGGTPEIGQEAFKGKGSEPKERVHIKTGLNPYITKMTSAKKNRD